MPYRYPIKYGKYLLTRRIAVGGMAEVFKAKLYGPRGFEKTLAIKRILPEFSEDEDFVGMFVDEARICSKLHHGNIVQVFDFGQVDDSYYLAMEFVDGFNLKHFFQRILKHNNVFPRHLAVYIVLQIAKGLEYAHQMKLNDDQLELVHRDISPQNILIAKDGQIKLTDFGIAKAKIKMSKTQPGKVQGKLSYMSPEQALGKKLDKRSDIFSLGLILYELIAGQKAYQNDDNTAQRYKKIRTAQIPPLKSLAPDISDYLQQKIMLILEKQIQLRPQNCTELIDSFSEYIEKFNEKDILTELSQWMQDFKDDDESVSKAAAQNNSLADIPEHVLEELSLQTQVKQEALGNIENEAQDEDATQAKFNFKHWLIKTCKQPFTFLKSQFQSFKHKTTLGKIIFASLGFLSLLLIASILSWLLTSTPSKSIAPPSKKPSSDNSQIESPSNSSKDLSQNRIQSQEMSLQRELDLAAKLETLEEELERIKLDQLEKDEALLFAQKQISDLENKLSQKNSAASVVPQCPKGMKEIPNGSFKYSNSDKNVLSTSPKSKNVAVRKFCMDQYEYPNQKSSTPLTNITWKKAKQKCQAIGKRLCSAIEWEYACASSKNNTYSYGNTFKEDHCNIKIDPYDSSNIQKSGRLQQCKNEFDVFDLTGNALEWTSTQGSFSQTTHLSKGGSMNRPKYQSECSSNLTFSSNHKEADLGFRCCKNF